ncbi:hypothetical protein HPB49_011049 [Dermacentor silvarum]|uniref:Uncharacterized protein n=1 Tax=Dermacentor silvarum TaxID=543639 RepID=A0ACB8C913_DERSI|nr:hypothetical protein HPB49_011049 [Dermacentor silvarum]
MQREEEQFDSFVTDFKLKARDCGFRNEREKMIRDQIVCGIYDEKARADILKLEDPTLEKVEKGGDFHTSGGRGECPVFRTAWVNPDEEQGTLRRSCEQRPRRAPRRYSMPPKLVTDADGWTSKAPRTPKGKPNPENFLTLILRLPAGFNLAVVRPQDQHASLALGRPHQF